MPSQIRAFLLLCVLLAGYQGFVFWQAVTRPLAMPALAATISCFAVQVIAILWLAWLAGFRRETLARWFFAFWLALRIVLPVALALRIAAPEAVLAAVLTASFWHNPEIPGLCLWAGAVYFVFSRGARPWFAKNTASPPAGNLSADPPMPSAPGN